MGEGQPRLLDRVRDRIRLRTVQELLGHKDASTTMIYTDVQNRGRRGVQSALDGVGVQPVFFVSTVPVGASPRRSEPSFPVPNAVFYFLLLSSPAPRSLKRFSTAVKRARDVLKHGPGLPDPAEEVLKGSSTAWKAALTVRWAAFAPGKRR